MVCWTSSAADTLTEIAAENLIDFESLGAHAPEPLSFVESFTLFSPLFQNDQACEFLSTIRRFP